MGRTHKKTLPHWIWARRKIHLAVMHTMLKFFPGVIIKLLMPALTSLDVDEVIRRMSQEELAFVKHMIRTSRSGTGFMNDIEHKLDDLSGITRPVLVMYSPNDKTVLPKNALRIAREIPTCELYEVPSDTHLIWIGKTANDVWQKRLAFLKSQTQINSAERNVVIKSQFDHRS